MPASRGRVYDRRMAVIAIEPAVSSRMDDIAHALGGGGDGASCQCQWWMMPNADWQRTDRASRERMLRAEVATAPAPALVAYVDGEAAGWVRVGPRPSQTRLGRTRAFATGSAQPWDDAGVWAVSCFVVRREYRGMGLNHRLLDAAIDHARRGGARVVEAYPIDTSVVAKRPNELFHGILSVFERAGFREVARPKPFLVVVEREL